MVWGLVLGLSILTVYDQFHGLSAITPGGDPHVLVNELQVARNHATLLGINGDPWQYRVGAEALAWLALKAATAAGFHEAGLVGFLSFRVLENVAIFGLAWLFYRRLGAGRHTAALGLVLVAFAMTQAHYHSALAFDTYAEVAVYLAAALLILDRRYAWIVPLTIVGTINRETCGLIPLMLASAALPLGPRTREGRRVLLLAALALVAYGVTFWTVRTIVGPGGLILPAGKHPGIEVFQLNVERGVTWDNLFRTWTLVPVLALAQWRAWPEQLRLFALAVVPAWIVLHFFLAVVAETRLMLVPYVLVFVPGALSGLRPAGTRGADTVARR
jgi:hypothetical protein